VGDECIGDYGGEVGDYEGAVEDSWVRCVSIGLGVEEDDLPTPANRYLLGSISWIHAYDIS
jgi:hypothetical protein